MPKDILTICISECFILFLEGKQLPWSEELRSTHSVQNSTNKTCLNTLLSWTKIVTPLQIFKQYGDLSSMDVISPASVKQFEVC